MGFHVAESSKGLKFDTQTEGRTVDMPFGSNPGNPEAKVWPTWAHLSLRSLAGMPYADHGEVVFQAWDGDRFKGRGPGRPMLSDVFWCFFFFGGGTPVWFQHVWLFKVQVETVLFQHRKSEKKTSTVHIETTCVMYWSFVFAKVPSLYPKYLACKQWNTMGVTLIDLEDRGQDAGILGGGYPP